MEQKSADCPFSLFCQWVRALARVCCRSTVATGFYHLRPITHRHPLLRQPASSAASLPQAAVSQSTFWLPYPALASCSPHLLQILPYLPASCARLLRLATISHLLTLPPRFRPPDPAGVAVTSYDFSRGEIVLLLIWIEGRNILIVWATTLSRQIVFGLGYRLAAGPWDASTPCRGNPVFFIVVWLVFLPFIRSVALH